VTSRLRASLGGVLTTVLVMVSLFLAVGWALSLIPADDGGLVGDAPPAVVPTRMPEVITADSFISVEAIEDLVADLEAETGVTQVFDVVIYPGYAVLDVPVDRETKRYRSYYWDGELNPSESRSTSTWSRFDLATLAPRSVVSVSQRARRTLVDDPTSWYVIVRAPDDEGASIWAYVQNDDDEGGYLSATAEGRVVRKVTW